MSQGQKSCFTSQLKKGLVRGHVVVRSGTHRDTLPLYVFVLERLPVLPTR